MSNKSIAKRKSVEDVPASARDRRAYCHTPSDRSNVFSDSAMMIREYCHTPIQIKAKFIYNHLISSEINRASGYNSCNPALTASAAMPATWGKVMPTRIYNRGAVADPAAISSGCNVNRFGASPANRPSDSRLIAHNYRLLPHLLSHILLPDDDPTPLPGSNIIWRLTHRLLMQFLVAKILHHHCFLYL